MDEITAMTVDQAISKLLRLSRDKLGDAATEKVTMAAQKAREFHAGQVRKLDQAPYVTHCISVAYHCLSWGLTDHRAICAALLHDAMEDAPPELKPEEWILEFDAKVYELVQALSKIRSLKTGVGDLPATYRRILGAASKDLRVLVIKTFDVFHNAQTLEVHGQAKAKNKASLSLIYVGVARRLGMVNLADAIIDRILPHLMPVQNDRAQRTLNNLIKKGRPSMERLRQHLQIVKGPDLVHEFSIDDKPLADFFYLTEKPGTGRLQRVGWPVYQARLLVPDDDAAWRVLGKMHRLFGPLPRHMRDYLNAPRVNGFRALITRVLWDGHPINVQVVRKCDDLANQMGILAEWGVSGPDPQRYMRLLATLGDSDLRMSEVHAHVLPDLLDVYTPKGDRLTFPVGAVVLDFAYLIHTDVGDRCLGAKINEIMRSPDYPLTDGDVVRVLTGKNGRPQRSWLDAVKTARARTLIKQALKSHDTPVRGINRTLSKKFQLTSLSGEDIRWSTCCLSVPNVTIVGRLSEGGMWIVHRADCSRIQPGPWEAGHWAVTNSHEILHVSFTVNHHSGALLPVLELLAQRNVNGQSIQGKGRTSEVYTIDMDWGGQTPEVLGQVLLELSQVPSVKEILSYSWKQG